jgi:hypothetical protein
MSVQGRDLLTGKPKQVEVSYREIAKLVRQIKELKMLLWKLYLKPPELAADIYNTGIYLRWWFYVARIGQKNFSKNRLTCLQKILYER